MSSYRNLVTAMPVALSEYEKGTTTMENIELEIPMQLLDAATITAAVKDIRFYLNAVAIDKGHIVSTDGHRGFACELENVDKELPQIIIPTESVKFFLKKIPAKNRKGLCQIKFDPKSRHGEILFEGLNAKESFIGCDGKYPDWQRIFPREVAFEYQGKYPTFNWAYLADFQKIHKAIGGNGLQVLLYPTGVNSAAKVEFDSTPYPKAKGVVMPLRA